MAIINIITVEVGYRIGLMLLMENNYGKERAKQAGGF